MNHFMARLIFCFFAEDTDILPALRSGRQRRDLPRSMPWKLTDAAMPSRIGSSLPS